MGKATLVISSELVRAARALLRWEQRDLAAASSVSLPTIKRLEANARPNGRPSIYGGRAEESA